MRKILVPFDGTENSLRVVQYAASAVQERPNVAIELLHVLDPMMFKSDAALPREEQSRLHAKEADSVLQPARKILDEAGVVYRTRHRVGAAASEIAAQVHESGYIGIIMGTRGMGPLASVMIGSVATRVVHLVDVPVTLIK